MLSPQQQADVIFYLGWPGTTLVLTSVNFNNVVYDRLTNTNSYIEAQVGGLLDRIAAIDLQLQAAPTRLITTEVGDIKLNADEIIRVRKERNCLLRDLSDLLDIPLMRSGGSKSILI